MAEIKVTATPKVDVENDVYLCNSFLYQKLCTGAR